MTIHVVHRDGSTTKESDWTYWGWWGFWLKIRSTIHSVGFNIWKMLGCRKSVERFLDCVDSALKRIGDL